MASFTHAVHTASTTNAAALTSGAFTPAAGDLLVVVAMMRTTAEVMGSVVTNSAGIPFVLAGIQADGTATSAVAVFIATEFATAVSQTCTHTAVGTTSGNIISVERLSGMSRKGLAALRQIARGYGNGTTPTGTFHANALTGNPTLATVFCATNPAGLTPPSGWTEAADTGFATPTTGLEVAVRDSGFTSTAIAWGSTATSYSLLTVEFDASSVSGPYCLSSGLYAWNPSAATADVPVGYAAGDLMLLVLETGNEPISAPSGWTEVSNSPSGTGAGGSSTSVAIQVFWRIATSSESAVSIADGGSHQSPMIFLIKDAHATSPIGNTAAAVDTTSTTSLSAPGVTTTSANELIMMFIGSDMDGSSSDRLMASYPVNSNLTEIATIVDFGTAILNGGGLTAIVARMASAGSTGATTATGTANMYRHAYLTVAITAGGGGGAPNLTAFFTFF